MLYVVVAIGSDDEVEVVQHTRNRCDVDNLPSMLLAEDGRLSGPLLATKSELQLAFVELSPSALIVRVETSPDAGSYGPTCTDVFVFASFDTAFTHLQEYWELEHDRCDGSDDRCPDCAVSRETCLGKIRAAFATTGRESLEFCDNFFTMEVLISNMNFDQV